VGKKKDSVALFEVISKSRQKRSEAGLNVPGWMGRGVPGGEPPERAEGAGEVEMPGPLPEPVVSTAGGRLRLSLNYVTALVAVVGMVLLLVLAFWVGRWSVHASAANATGPDAQTAGLTGEQTPTPPGPATPGRVPGKHYLVIQGLQGMTQQKRDDAETIVKWLKKEGIAADIGRYRGDPEQYIVWSLNKFDSPSSAEAEGFVDTIEELGRRYKNGGGRYDFKQRPGDPWFIRHQ
jgi:hypothetical protein